MKRIIVLIVICTIGATALFAQQKGIIHTVLEKSVEAKVAAIQDVLKFSDTQAKAVKELELRYLLDVQKAERCCWCNQQKRIKKLKLKRDEALEKVLDRALYIRYKAVEEERIQPQPLWAN